MVASTLANNQFDLTTPSSVTLDNLEGKREKSWQREEEKGR
jgi:hypothetical protein